MSVDRISVFGLGKLGATMVGCFASAGYDVIGVDVNQESVAKVAAGEAPVAEPGLQKLYDEAKSRITATVDAAQAIRDSDASFIIVPTPSMPDGEFFTSIAAKVAESIGSELKRKDGYHLVVLTSTVLPGATERDIKSALERTSGKKCGKDFGLCYSPEFIAIGNVIEGLVNPDFFLIGESDEKAGDVLEEIYRRMGSMERGEGAEDRGRTTGRGTSGVSDFNGFNDLNASTIPPILRMNIPNAELTKIAVNTFVTGKISFANTLARICGSMPGGDAHVVARAVGADKRVGRRYLSPGPTFGGPCFPRDNRAFEWFARSVGQEAPLARATDEVNRHQVDFVVKLLLESAPDATTVGLLGLSYKPNTNLMEESMAVDMARRLLGRGLSVIAYDPWVRRHGTTEEVEGMKLAESAAECVGASDIVVLCTTHEEFTELTPGDFTVQGKTIPLVDVWGFFRDKGFAGQPHYRAIGVR